MRNSPPQSSLEAGSCIKTSRPAPYGESPSSAGCVLPCTTPAASAIERGAMRSGAGISRTCSSLRNAAARKLSTALSNRASSLCTAGLTQVTLEFEGTLCALPRRAAGEWARLRARQYAFGTRITRARAGRPVVVRRPRCAGWGCGCCGVKVCEDGGDTRGSAREQGRGRRV